MDNNVVRQSSDYEQFSLLEANRDQSRGHVEALKAAFEEMGNLTRVQPILVNGQLQIIDGQHRFTACKELGQPIYYTVVEGLSVREARQMNILHRGWNTDDYVKSYAATDPNYAKYGRLKKEYGFSHSIMLVYITGVLTKGLFKVLHSGEFVLEDEAGARQRLDKLDELREVYPEVGLRNMALPMLRLMASDNYDQARIVSKLRQYGGKLKKMTNSEDNLRQIEDLYNFNQAEGSRARLY